MGWRSRKTDIRGVTVRWRFTNLEYEKREWERNLNNECIDNDEVCLFYISGGISSNLYNTVVSFMTFRQLEAAFEVDGNWF